MQIKGALHAVHHVGIDDGSGSALVAAPVSSHHLRRHRLQAHFVH